MFEKDRLTRYIQTLVYLTNPLIHMDLKTYDERILYLIMSADPELVSFKEFLKTTLTPKSTIEAETDPKVKQQLIHQREAEVLDLQSRIREKLGFYDSKLVRYEEYYFKKFLSSKVLINKVTQDNISKLLRITPFIKTLTSVTDERFQELQEKAQNWISITNCENDLYTAAYSCLNQSDTIGLNSIIEELVFFILIGDPNLDALRIYEEESRTEDMQNRCIETFNYFNSNLFTLEKLYHDRFCPDKELSPWTYM